MQLLKQPVLQLVLAAILWSSGGLLVKWVEMRPLALAGARSVIAGVTILLLTRRGRFTFSAPQLGGAAAYAATVILFVAATKLTTAANAIMLQYTAPIYIALFGAWFLGEKPQRADWLLMVMAQFGTALFFMGKLTLAGLWGNVFALASGLTLAGMVMCLRKQKDASPIESVVLGNLLTAVIGLPFLAGETFTIKACAGLVLLGVFQLGISYVLYTAAIKHVRALEATLIGTIEPVLNPIWVLMLLGEKPTPWAMAGGAVVIGAATVRGILTARQRPAGT